MAEVTGILSAADFRMLLADQDREGGQRASLVLSIKFRKWEVRGIASMQMFHQAGEDMELLCERKPWMPPTLNCCWSPRKMLCPREHTDGRSERQR